jgi:hypothetical protein
MARVNPTREVINRSDIKTAVRKKIVLLLLMTYSLGTEARKSAYVLFGLSGMKL